MSKINSSSPAQNKNQYSLKIAKLSQKHCSYAEAIRSLRSYFFGPSDCLYSVGCIDYTVNQFLTQSFFKAVKNSFLRIISCNPFTKRQ